MSGQAAAAPRDIVLLVDDSPEALGFLTDALEQSGFSALIATSGQAALNIAERITPDIILLDAVMPAMDGFETCRRLKANAAVAQVPVIFMTGLTETEHVVRALESGGVDYLTKPINIDELRARIRVHLSNARSAQSARVALDAAGRHLLAVRANGAIHWSTPQATRLVNAATGRDDGMEIVTSHIGRWLAERAAAETGRDVPLTITEAGRPALQLSFLGAMGPDEFLFRLTAANEKSGDHLLREHFSLTARESEVLLWIARGKSNRDIGDILGLSARTVNKHLEQIYVKLGVENRASAAVKAAHILHQG
ncbi:LuxR family transcriptional regulator [Agrobacterium sp. TS43]|jgi:DNA-binding response OmpR family regulator|uniref:Two-component transcriptional regulator, CheY-LuxR families (Two-component signal transduction system) n=1 Tax=Agrobacterium deltaense Zutra 3/1 TaxID=1183427 RepID=A0A1S7QK03_9HYPH|nr:MULTISPECIES: response regulator [Rhizobium/Agrobacterium group]KDR90678.1 LuxR family transcriptional regulator [Agrobacterium tumefaciens GW4]KVK46143.1 LuxR family transcriptional regulator [Agrobacterium sp. LY4]KVK46280.1 LuxR family transcriptional regulator [Agrobacterium sp. JL28]KVK59696.1 LuxR family transcriptional regulator [Agrobacterium sp. TS45]KVK64028.1 LuxR family transcriptional regulator [Agrobacterium sp. C13]